MTDDNPIRVCVTNTEPIRTCDIPEIPDDYYSYTSEDVDSEISESLHYLCEKLDKMDSDSKKESKRAFILSVIDLLFSLAILILAVIEFAF